MGNNQLTAIDDASTCGLLAWIEVTVTFVTLIQDLKCELHRSFTVAIFTIVTSVTLIQDLECEVITVAIFTIVTSVTLIQDLKCEVITVTIFTIEYLFRWWAAAEESFHATTLLYECTDNNIYLQT